MPTGSRICDKSNAAITGTVPGRYPHGARRSRRAIGLLLSQTLSLLSIGALANRQLRWFSSWSDFVGTPTVVATQANPQAALDRQLAVLSRRLPSNRGYIVNWVAMGASSRIAQRAKAYLPPSHFSNAGLTMRFPVIELLAGFPGGPDAWLHPSQLVQTAILPSGGHNFRVWRALDPAALD